MVLPRPDAPIPSRGVGRLPNANTNVRTVRFDVRGAEMLVVEWYPARSLSLAELTAAERDVARLVMRGATNADIARSRKTSARTVANQVASILRKLEVRSRVELAALLSRAR
jgi:DNA-binding CsgD family transcriptional regulator